MLLRMVTTDRPLPRTGASFLVVVALQSLAVLAASIAAQLALHWLAFLALLPFALGLGAYAVVLRRFDFEQLRLGSGDQWVSGGALAISTLTCAELSHATRMQAGLHDLLHTGSLVLWVLTTAWLPVLAGAEARTRRPRYDVRRWATVFRLGMYSPMSFTVGAGAGSAPIVTFAPAWAWVSLAAWIATMTGAARATRTPGRSPAPDC